MQHVEEVLRAGGDAVKAVAVVLGMVEELIHLRLVVLRNALPDGLQPGNVVIQELRDVVCVGHADLLPHHRRRGGDAGNVLKAAGCDGMHDRIVGVGCLHEIDQRRRDDVRQVRDAGNRIIMEGTGDHERNGLDLPDELLHDQRLLLRRFLRGRHDVVGVLQKAGPGVVIARPLGAGHGVPADKIRREPGLLHMRLNVALGGADVGQNGGRLEMPLQGMEVLSIFLDGCAQENHVAVLEHGAVQRAVVAASAAADDAVLYRLLQRVTGRIVSQNIRIRPVLADRLCNGAADQAEPDKAEMHRIEICHRIFLRSVNVLCRGSRRSLLFLAETGTSQVYPRRAEEAS